MQPSVYETEQETKGLPDEAACNSILSSVYVIFSVAPRIRFAKIFGYLDFFQNLTCSLSIFTHISVQHWQYFSSQLAVSRMKN